MLFRVEVLPGEVLSKGSGGVQWEVVLSGRRYCPVGCCLEGVGLVLSGRGRWCCSGWRCCQGRCCPRVVVLSRGWWCCSVGSGAVQTEVLSGRAVLCRDEVLSREEVLSRGDGAVHNRK